MKKRTTPKAILSALLLASTMLLGLTACGNTTQAPQQNESATVAIDGPKFEEIAEGLNYFVYDQSSLTAQDNPAIEQSYIAFSKDDQTLNFEFDVYKDVADTNALYTYLVGTLENNKETLANPVASATDNRYMLESDSDGYFYYVCKADRSIFIAFTQYQYKPQVIELATAMGYLN